MAQQLLWLETLLKLAGATTLLIMPLAAARILGLPAPQAGLWPRLLGAALLGMAGAAFLEGSIEGSSGLGLGGLALINLVTAATLVALLTFERASQTRRGRTFLWGMAAGHIALSLMEIAVA